MTGMLDGRTGGGGVAKTQRADLEEGTTDLQPVTLVVAVIVAVVAGGRPSLKP